ncbi:ABC transporter ATP-binding protein [Streptococcus equinus]|uniref:ABC transporter ATP-binding protein n=1 Tax=Streptococcus equinus TaxID=1335 RepID=UPI003BF906E5
MNKGLLKLLFSFINKKKFFVGLCLSFIGTLLGLMLPQFIGKLLDENFLKSIVSEKDTLFNLVGFFIFVYTVQAVASYLIGTCGSQAMNKLQKQVYSNLLLSSIKNLDSFKAGDLSSRLTNDMSVVLNFVTVVLPNFILNLVTIVGSIILLFQISPSMTSMSLLVIPLLAGIIIPINRKLEDYYAGYQGNISDISSKISHKFLHIRLIKAFKGEKAEKNDIGSFFDKLSLNYNKIIKISAIQGTLVNSSMMAFIIMLLVIAGISVSKGEMTIATLTTFVLYITQLIDPVTDISDSMTELTEFSSVSNRLMEILNLEKEENKDVDLNLVDTSISLNNLHFAYENEDVLNGLTVDIPSGKHIAVVGPSGAGKSTIFSLLMKFYQNYRGNISVGQRDLMDISPKQMRTLISYIPQDNTLFHGSIRDNLFYGKNQNVSEERLSFVLETLGLSKLVNDLDDGLDTMISDSGTGLSEGQKQRFNIARALLVEHPIYLLDEVTASLDSVTERIVSKAIDKLTAGKTRLTIAHRLHTVREADAILVLNKNGTVADYGTHQQLLKRNNLYQDFLSGLQKAS